MNGLFNAVENEDYVRVKQLLENGFNVNYKDKYGNTLLHEAVRHNYVPIIKLLLKYGANINTKNKFGETPLSLSREYDADLELYI